MSKAPEGLHGETLVNFVDGRSLSIKQVVNEKIFGKVWSFDGQAKAFVPAEITSHHLKGKAKDGELLTITSEAIDTKNGVLSATLSTTCLFLTSEGLKPASALVAGDKLLSKYESKINGTLRQFLLGTGCGDSHFAVPKGGKRAQIKIEDSENPDYSAWKVSLLQPFFSFTAKPNDSNQLFYRSSGRTDLFFLKEQFEGCRNPQIMFDNFSWLAFALWIMDDGSFEQTRGRYKLAIGRYQSDPAAREAITAALNGVRLRHSWHQRKQVQFEKLVSDTIAMKIREFVPPCMHYKLPWCYRGLAGLQSLSSEIQHVPEYVKVLTAEGSSARKYRDRQYYDIHVDGPNNYLLGNLDNGFVVHNTV